MADSKDVTDLIKSLPELKAFFEESLVKIEPPKPESLEPHAEAYATSAGLPYSKPVPAPHNPPELFHSAAKAYGELKHDPNHPDVKASYDALKQETLKQYDFLKPHAVFQDHAQEKGKVRGVQTKAIANKAGAIFGGSEGRSKNMYHPDGTRNQGEAVGQISSNNRDKFFAEQPQGTYQREPIEYGQPTFPSRGAGRRQLSISADHNFWHALHLASGGEPMDKSLPMAPPALHGTVEGFMSGLKSLPKGSPARGKFITQHMHHPTFLTALHAHPQGQQIHTMLTTHMNSQANAGFKPGQSQVMVKAWPKSEADNQSNIQAHLVLQDKLMGEGKQLKHTNSKMQNKGDVIYAKARTHPRMAQAASSNMDQRQNDPTWQEGTPVEPNPWAASRMTSGFWQGVSRSAGLAPQIDTFFSDRTAKWHEAMKNRFPAPATPGAFDAIFAHLTDKK